MTGYNHDHHGRRVVAVDRQGTECTAVVKDLGGDLVEFAAPAGAMLDLLLLRPSSPSAGGRL